MRSTPNKPPAAFASALAVLALCAITAAASAAEEPATLRLVLSPGLVVLDDDSLQAEGGEDRVLELELEPGEHVLRYFPYHAADEWIHRYLVYPFSVGSAGHRTIDLINRQVFTFRTEPQSAILRFRGRYLGRTPGDFMLLAGEGDSVVASLEGYEDHVFHLDRLHGEREYDVFVDLERRIEGEREEGQSLAYQYQNPVKKLMTPGLMISLGSGVALLAAGAYLNQEADKYYDRYQHLIGPQAREEAFDRMQDYDRWSRITLIAGDTALGVFGYLLVRRFIFPADGGQPGDSPSGGRLSMELSTREAQLSIEF